MSRVFSNVSKWCLFSQFSRNLSGSAETQKVCVVGSGPAGFYTAQHILKGNSNCVVDVYDRLPVPFGLVRYGVAPDHPEVKNVINTFTKTMGNPRANFLGNVNVGVDVSVQELRDAYHAVVLSYGCDEDHKLGIPGEDHQNVVSAREFVNWYNGLPSYCDLNVDLSCERAVVIGQGNVAIDVARILLSPIDLLAKTDITDKSLAVLSESKIKQVLLVGRRGPLNAAFTIKELREMIKLPGCKPNLIPEDYKGILDQIKDASRAKKRITELLVKTGLEAQNYEEATRTWGLRFLRSPKSFEADDQKKVKGVELYVNKLEGTFPKQRAVSTEETEYVDCGLVLRSVGYKGVMIDDCLPLDEKRGVVQNEKGRVTGLSGVYASGWIQSGPVGVIISTMTNGFDTGKLVLQDLSKETTNKPGSAHIRQLLSGKGVQVCSFKDWEKLDKVEVERGKGKGKLREKITTTEEMLHIINC